MKFSFFDSVINVFYYYLVFMSPYILASLCPVTVDLVLALDNNINPEKLNRPLSSLLLNLENAYRHAYFVEIHPYCRDNILDCIGTRSPSIDDIGARPVESRNQRLEDMLGRAASTRSKDLVDSPEAGEDNAKVAKWESSSIRPTSVLIIAVDEEPSLLTSMKEEGEPLRRHFIKTLQNYNIKPLLFLFSPTHSNYRLIIYEGPSMKAKLNPVSFTDPKQLSDAIINVICETGSFTTEFPESDETTDALIPASMLPTKVIPSESIIATTEKIKFGTTETPFGTFEPFSPMEPRPTKRPKRPSKPLPPRGITSTTELPFSYTKSAKPHTIKPKPPSKPLPPRTTKSTTEPLFSYTKSAKPHTIKPKPPRKPVPPRGITSTTELPFSYTKSAKPHTIKPKPPSKPLPPRTTKSTTEPLFSYTKSAKPHTIKPKPPRKPVPPRGITSTTELPFSYTKSAKPHKIKPKHPRKPLPPRTITSTTELPFSYTKSAKPHSIKPKPPRTTMFTTELPFVYTTSIIAASSTTSAPTHKAITGPIIGASAGLVALSVIGVTGWRVYSAKFKVQEMEAEFTIEEPVTVDLDRETITVVGESDFVS